MEETKYYLSSYIKGKERVYELTKVSENNWETTIIIRLDDNSFRAFNTSGNILQEKPKGQEIDHSVYVLIYENIKNFLNKTEDLFSCFPNCKTNEINIEEYTLKRVSCIKSGLTLRPLPNDIPEYILNLIPFRVDDMIIVSYESFSYLKELRQQTDNLLIKSFITQIMNKAWPENEENP